jgi:acetylornithine deacetylase/succinyl-diaminopimelate desuccinylase-like protein
MGAISQAYQNLQMSLFIAVPKTMSKFISVRFHTSVGLKETASILKKIEDRQMDYVKELQTLVRQPSVSATGLGINECASLVKEILEKRGISSTILRIKDANPLVYGEVRVRGAKKTLLFYNHYDVQPPEPLELWGHGAFSGDVDNGRVYGRGAADDKGEIVSRLAVFDSFADHLEDLGLNFKFVIEGEEEIGSQNLLEYARQNKERFSADSGIWEFGGVDTKGRPVVRLGMKGLLYVELMAKGAKRDLHSSLAAIVESPVWRLVRALHTLKDSEDNITIEGWYDKVRPLFEYERILLEKYPFDEEGAKSSYGVSSFINNLTGFELKKKLIAMPTCNICGIWAGYTGKGSKTVLPSEARAKIDFRLVPDQDPDELKVLLRKHLDSKGFRDIEVYYTEGEKAARVNPNEPISQAAIKAAFQVYSTEGLVEISSPATGPLYVFTDELKVPCVAIGTGHPDDAQHSPNESKSIDSFIKGTKWVAQTVYNYATGQYT